GQARRAKAVLAEQVALAATAEHLVVSDVEVADTDFAVVAAAGHRVDVANDLAALVAEVGHEGGSAGVRRGGGPIRSSGVGPERAASAETKAIAVGPRPMPSRSAGR